MECVQGVVAALLQLTRFSVVKPELTLCDEAFLCQGYFMDSTSLMG